MGAMAVHSAAMATVANRHRGSVEENPDLIVRNGGTSKRIPDDGQWENVGLPGQETVKSWYTYWIVQWAIAALIMGNFITNCIEKEHDPFGHDHKQLYRWINFVWNIIFIFELLANMWATPMMSPRRAAAPRPTPPRLVPHHALTLAQNILELWLRANTQARLPCRARRACSRCLRSPTPHLFPPSLCRCRYANWWKAFAFEKRGSYFIDLWNAFDLLVVAISLPTLPGTDLGAFGRMRTLRAFRVFRLFKRVPALKKILQSLARAVPGIVNAAFVMLLVMCIYAILAVDFFGEFGAGGTYVNNNGDTVTSLTTRGMDWGNEYYGGFWRALFTLFQASRPHRLRADLLPDLASLLLPSVSCLLSRAHVHTHALRPSPPPTTHRPPSTAHRSPRFRCSPASPGPRRSRGQCCLARTIRCRRSPPCSTCRSSC